MKEVELIGDLNIPIALTNGGTENILVIARYVPGFQVSLIPELTLVEQMKLCDITYNRSTGQKMLHFDGVNASGAENRIALLKDRRGLKLLPIANYGSQLAPPLRKSNWAATATTVTDTVPDTGTNEENTDEPDTDPGLSVRLFELHLQLGHAGARAMLITAEQQGWRLSTAEKKQLRNFKHVDCHGCDVAKHIKKSTSKKPEPGPAKKPHSIVSCDWIPFEVKAIGENVGAWLFTDTNTSAPYCYPCSSKDKYIESLEQYLIDAGFHVNGSYKGPQILRSDTDSVVFSEESCAYYRRVIGCRPEASPPGHHSQNYVEGRWYPIKRKVVATMQATGAPPKLWGHCIRYVCRQVRCTGRAGHTLLPLEEQLGRRIRLKDEVPHPFGASGVVTRWATGGSLTPAGKRVLFIGKSDRSQTVVVYDPVTGRTSEAYSFRRTKSTVPWLKPIQTPPPPPPPQQDTAVWTTVETTTTRKSTSNSGGVQVQPKTATKPRTKNWIVPQQVWNKPLQHQRRQERATRRSVKHAIGIEPTIPLAGGENTTAAEITVGKLKVNNVIEAEVVKELTVGNLEVNEHEPVEVIDETASDDSSTPGRR